MKFIAKYFNNGLYKKMYEEAYGIIFEIHEETTLNDVLSLSERYSDKLIVLDFSDGYDADYLLGKIIKHSKEYKDTFLNFRMRFKPIVSKTITTELYVAGIKFYIDIIATSWDELYALKNNGCSIIYVGGELGFDLYDVAMYLGKYDIEVGVYPNGSRQEFYKTIDPLRRFWIRPEDLEVYEEYVNYYSIDDEDDFDYPSAQFYYWKYYYKGSYGNYLNDFIHGLDDCEYNINSATIHSDFGYARMACRRKCMTYGSCHICDRLLTMSQLMEDAGYEIKTRKVMPLMTNTN